MKISHLVIISLLFATIVGCDTLNKRQFLLNSKLNENQIQKLRTTIEKALSATIEKYNLVNSVQDAHTEGVLLYYKTNNNFPIQLGARNTDKGIVIDLIIFHPGTGELEEYQSLSKDILEDLRKLEEINIIELDYQSQIK